MDIAIHFGAIKHLKSDAEINVLFPVMAIILDLVVLVAFCWIKFQSDVLIIWVTFAALIVLTIAELLFLKYNKDK